MINKSEKRPLRNKPKELRFIQLEVIWLSDNLVLIKAYIKLLHRAPVNHHNSQNKQNFSHV